MILTKLIFFSSKNRCIAGQGSPMNTIIPQKSVSDQQTSVKTNISQTVFWYETLVAKKRRICIDESKLLDFLQESGFGRYENHKSRNTSIFRKLNGEITQVSSEKVRDFVLDYVDTLPAYVTFSFSRNDLKNLLIKKPALFSRSRLRCLQWLSEPQKNGGSHVAP